MAFGAITNATPDTYQSFFAKKNGLWVTTPDGKALVDVVATQRVATPFAATADKKTVGFLLAPPGSPGPVSAAGAAVEAFKNPEVAIFISKKMIVPDQIAYPMVITTDPKEFAKQAKDDQMFFYGGKNYGSGLLSASIFGIPAWALAAVAGVGLFATMGAKKARY